MPPLTSDNGERGSVSQFSRAQGLNSSDRFYRGVNQTSTSINQQMSANRNCEHTLNDISIMSPTLGGAQQISDFTKKAQIRLETVCLLLAETGTVSESEKEKQQLAIANVLEDMISNQANKYDSKSLRLLMDFQWQTAANAQTLKLQEELASVKARFENQTKI